MTKKALITGITGQDGSYLAEHLISLGYKVYGLIRRNSITEHQQSRLEHLQNDIENRYGDVLDSSSLNKILNSGRLNILSDEKTYFTLTQSHLGFSGFDFLS